MTKNWTVNKLSINSGNQEFENLVDYVQFTFNYSDENVSRDVVIGSDFDPPTDYFVDYNNLTEDIVLNWLYEKPNFSDMENNIIESITNPKGEIVFEETNPWEQS